MPKNPTNYIAPESHKPHFPSTTLRKSLKTLSKSPKSAPQIQKADSDSPEIKTCIIRFKTYNRTLFVSGYKLRSPNEYVLYFGEEEIDAQPFDEDDYIIPFCQNNLEGVEVFPYGTEIEPEILSQPKENVPIASELDWI